MPSDDEGGAAAAAPAHEHKVGLMGMIVMGFFWVCGGMYDEELLQAGPPLYVLTALAVVPLIHSLPVSLISPSAPPRGPSTAASPSSSSARSGRRSAATTPSSPGSTAWSTRRSTR